MHNTNVKKDAIANERGEALAHSFLRRKTMEKVRSEIINLREKYNPTFLYFIDDSFLARPKNEIFAFCDMYEEFKIPFWFNTRPENCKEDVLKRLKEVEQDQQKAKERLAMRLEKRKSMKNNPQAGKGRKSRKRRRRRRTKKRKRRR